LSGFLLLLRLAYFRLSFSLSSTQQIKPGGEQVSGETKERRRRRRETTTARRREEAMGIVLLLLLLLLVGCGLGFSSFLGFFFFFFLVLRQKTDSSLREEKWEWEGGRGGEERERKRGCRDGRHGDKRGEKKGGRDGRQSSSPCPTQTSESDTNRLCRRLPTHTCRQRGKPKKTPSDTENYAHQQRT
jgi:hypothetical protein